MCPCATPTQAPRLIRPQLNAALRRAGRQRGIAAACIRLQAIFRRTWLHQLPLVEQAQANVTLVAADLNGVRVYPNPWRSDKHQGRSITFDNLTVNTTVKLFTVSGHHVKTLPTSSTVVTWDLTNDSGDKVASGLYVYLITTGDSGGYGGSGQKKTGKVAVIK